MRYRLRVVTDEPARRIEQLGRSEARAAVAVGVDGGIEAPGMRPADLPRV